uniref:FSA_C domain-containing protein n=1 Tax=Ascaris lumbricoides TaxID=6252 RepID=A0A0M3HVI3_ASCLU
MHDKLSISDGRMGSDERSILGKSVIQYEGSAPSSALLETNRLWDRMIMASMDYHTVQFPRQILNEVMAGD